MPNSRPRRHARRLTRVLAASVLPLAGLFAGLVPALAIPGYAGAMTSCRNWTGTPPLVTPGSESAGLHSVAALSRCDVWTVGETFGPSQAFIEHWNGSFWDATLVPQPDGDNFQLLAIQALSPNDIWAVGDSLGNGVQTTLALHWDGRAWTRTLSKSPQPTSGFLGVRAISASNVWAVGLATADGDHDHTLVEHWNGTAWRVVQSASFPGRLQAVGASSRTDVWAVGQVFSGFREETLTVHWDGRHWVRKTSPSPGPTGNTLNSVTAISASNAWAVGFAANTSGTASDTGTATLILHWNGRNWFRVKSPSPGGKAKSDELFGVAALSARNIVAVGDDFSANRGLVLVWNGTSWVREPGPGGDPGTQLEDVAASSASNVWAVGALIPSDPGQVFATRFALAAPRP